MAQGVGWRPIRISGLKTGPKDYTIISNRQEVQLLGHAVSVLRVVSDHCGSRVYGASDL